MNTLKSLGLFFLFTCLCCPSAGFSLEACFENGDCANDSDYCAKNLGNCSGQGFCEPRPENCSGPWMPVCGCDGETYSNDCIAAQKGVSLEILNECRTGPLTWQVCPEGCFYNTISSAVFASADGDTVLVKDGTYGPFDFAGRAITVSSENGPERTVIEGAYGTAAVQVSSGEDITTVLEGFTLTGGTTCCGGGLAIWASSPTIRNCIVRGNTSTGEGGGIYLWDSDARIINTIVSGNRAQYGGGIACTSASSPKILNSTVSGNYATFLGGGLSIWDGNTVLMVNSVVWDNGADGYNGIYVNPTSTLTAQYTNIQDDDPGNPGSPWPGEGNLNASPQFVGPGLASDAPTVNGDYHLRTDSPCIDSGTSDKAAYPDLPSDDIDGDARPIGDEYDMGAEEYAPSNPPIIPNNVPVVSDQSVSTDEDRSVAITLSATDGDDDSLTYTIVSGPSNGILTGTAPNVTYTPSTGFSGTDSFTFTANDGMDDSNTATVTITVNERPAPTKNDFDGDGITDIGIFRPSEMTWYVFQSTDGPMAPFQFGSFDDMPVPADYDGDGYADLAIFRPSTVTWYVFGSSAGPMDSFQFGAVGDMPVPADYDGDGTADLAIYRPSTMTWYVFGSTDGPMDPFVFGGIGDIPVPADYDGDGLADLAIFRPSNVTWYIFGSSAGPLDTFQFGTLGDLPVPGDYDGDGQVDRAIFRPSTVTWYIFGSTDGPLDPFQFGTAGDQPIR